MSPLTRRQLLQGAAASVVVMALPAVAQAQVPWGLVGELLLKALNGLAAGATIADYFYKWGVDKNCAVPTTQLRQLEFQGELILDSLNKDGGGGAIPALQTFIAKSDSRSWRQARIALGDLLNNGATYMALLTGILKTLDLKSYPGSQTDFDKLADGLTTAKAAVAQLASASDEPGSDALKLAKSALEAIKDLPAETKSATSDLHGIITARGSTC